MVDSRDKELVRDDINRVNDIGVDNMRLLFAAYWEREKEKRLSQEDDDSDHESDNARKDGVDIDELEEMDGLDLFWVTSISYEVHDRRGQTSKPLESKFLEIRRMFQGQSLQHLLDAAFKAANVPPGQQKLWDVYLEKELLLDPIGEAIYGWSLTWDNLCLRNLYAAGDEIHIQLRRKEKAHNTLEVPVHCPSGIEQIHCFDFT